MVIIPKPDTKCKDCIWARYRKSRFLFGCRYVCRLNLFKSVSMGVDNVHSQRKTNLEKQKQIRKILKGIK